MTVAPWRTGSLFASHAAHADLFLHKGVIVGALLERSSAQTIAAAVANVEDPNAPVIFRQGGKQADKRGAHAGEALIALST